MKVIGMANNSYSSQEYVCIVSHTEIEKFLDLYYRSTNQPKLEKLTIGQEIDLGKGHDHAKDIAQAFRQSQEFIRAHEKIVTAILNGLAIDRILQPANETTP